MLFYFLTILISVQSAPNIFGKNHTLSTATQQVDEEVHENSSFENLSKRSSFNQDVHFIGDGNFFEDNFESINLSNQSYTFVPRPWNNQTIPYTINSNIGESGRKVIYNALNEFHERTCLKFRKRSRHDVDYVDFFNSGKGCWAHVGRVGGRQIINLGSYCYYREAVLHEMMHTIGFDHEHVRPNRDEYITVNFDIMPEDVKKLFQKQSTEYWYNEGFPYDLCSVTHYHGYIVPKVNSECWRKPYTITISNIDTQRIRKMYRCT